MSIPAIVAITVSEVPIVAFSLEMLLDVAIVYCVNVPLEIPT